MIIRPPQVKIFATKKVKKKNISLFQGLESCLNIFFKKNDEPTNVLKYVLKKFQVISSLNIFLRSI